MSQSTLIQEHYVIGELSSRLDHALLMSGLAEGPFEWSQLSLVDQFHAQGLDASKELALALGAKQGDHILDIGSGLGGPARFLSAVYGCHVTGIDLTPEYVEIANRLTKRTGQAEYVTFVQGDAMHLPFDPETFDHAWTQHVGMNIEDKDGFYRGVYRVLKTGGKFAIYDMLKQGDQPILYPVPWARDASYSFVVTPESQQKSLEAAGFAVIASVDKTEEALQSLQAFGKLAQTPNAIPPLNLSVLLGPSTGPMIANMARNIQEGRLQVRQVI
ncbi:MAG TPA: class I SAM-dependent methyltransferase, partial [Chthonomonadaceae bacterium]|nr:class I SAM-dependent methyltransferase [Chthonomonadaceae bacterium]